MEREQLKKLIKQYQDSSISDQDLLLLKRYLETDDKDDALMDVWEECGQLKADFLPHKDNGTRLFRNILSDPRVQSDLNTRKQLPFKSIIAKIAAAACILLLLKIGVDLSLKSGVFYDLLRNNTEELAQIVPGSNKGTILLEDGRMVDLENIRNDTTIYFEGFSINKAMDGSLSYSIDPSLSETKIVYNTIITPKGGEYKLVLSDGTEVWLNSSTQLKYPINFGNDSRDVELIGEAYFDVKKKTVEGKRLPFIVKTGNQKLEVLGTSFNVNSYGDQIETTLVEGMVKLTYKDKKEYFLKPNQQAIYEQNNKSVKISNVDPFYITAWKSGSFAFDNTSIYDVMESVSRWYDVDVNYKDNLKGITFTGTVSRFENIDKLLKTIEMTGSVTFKIEGRRVLVMK